MKDHHPKCPRAQAWDTDAPCRCPAGWPRRERHLIRVPRSLPRHAARVATAALMAFLLAVALAGCDNRDRIAEARNARARTQNAAMARECREAGGAPFRPDYCAPAEAPEGGAP